jgi:HlyD family secretion protein
VVVAALAAACNGDAADTLTRATGYVEATDVRVASRVPGRVAEVRVAEGESVEAGAVMAVLSTAELDLALRRAQAERAQADAQLRLVRSGARREDIDQAEAQVAAASAEIVAAETERAAARADETRFDQLLQKRAGSEKQRDDARARRELADARVKAASDRRASAEAVLARVRAGSRPEEVDAARGRLAAVEAQIATIEHDKGDTTITAPTSGIVTARLVEPGELVNVGTPLVVIVDLAHAWVNAYFEEPVVPSLRIGQAVQVVTDGGDRLAGTIASIAPRAEFTPRNVQTSAERARLVYRAKVTVDNTQGVLKPGMPVEVEVARP